MTEATVCHRQMNSELGGATVYCVRLADGFLVECGADGYAQFRAENLARAINLSGSHMFERENMRRQA